MVLAADASRCFFNFADLLELILSPSDRPLADDLPCLLIDDSLRVPDLAASLLRGDQAVVAGDAIAPYPSVFDRLLVELEGSGQSVKVPLSASSRRMASLLRCIAVEYSLEGVLEDCAVYGAKIERLERLVQGVVKEARMQRVPASAREVSRFKLGRVDQLASDQLGRGVFISVHGETALLAVDEELLALDSVLLEEGGEELADRELCAMPSEAVARVDVVQPSREDGVLESVILLEVFARYWWPRGGAVDKLRERQILGVSLEERDRLEVGRADDAAVTLRILAGSCRCREALDWICCLADREPGVDSEPVIACAFPMDRLTGASVQVEPPRGGRPVEHGLVPEVHLVLLSVLDELESLSAALIAPWLDVVGTILRNAARYFRIDLEGIRREVRLLGRCLLHRSCPPEVPRKSECRYDTPRKHMSLFK